MYILLHYVAMELCCKFKGSKEECLKKAKEIAIQASLTKHDDPITIYEDFENESWIDLISENDLEIL